MAEFIWNCGDCGTISIQTPDITRFAGFFMLRCPKCDAILSHEMTETHARLLTLGEVHEVEAPAEFLETKSGPPISLDDLIDLMQEVDHGNPA